MITIVSEDFDPRAIVIKAGLPFGCVIRVTDGKTLWSSLGAFEVRSQYRATDKPSSKLIANLHNFMTVAYGTGPNANDIEITWEMTGAQTRGINYLGKGHYDVVISDVGTTDAKGEELLDGSITFEALTTKPEGDL